MNPKVSIITPVYNSQKFLEECILSVQNQSYSNWEHILVDDCSKDDSLSIIRKYAEKDNRIKYHQLKKNSGAGVARNFAIEKAIGSYIAFLDSDDIWFPKKLEMQLDFMKENDYHFTFTDYEQFKEEDTSEPKIIRCKAIVTYSRALLKNPIGCLTVVYDAKHFGKKYMPSIRKRQDYALWLELLKLENGYGLDKCLARYRTGNDSIPANKMDLLKYEWRIYREVEGLSWIRSSFYLLSAVVLKLKSYL